MCIKTNLSKFADCQKCTETTHGRFEYIEIQKGNKYVAEEANTYIIVFFLTGKALVTNSEYKRDLIFHEEQIACWPIHIKCEWKALLDTTCIVLFTDNEIPPCDKKAIRDYADLWLEIVPDQHALEIKQRLKEYLQTMKNYLIDGFNCPLLHKIKQRELSFIFRAYYTKDEILPFFLPIVRNTNEFEWFIMQNYLSMKGVKEFVDLSGMTLSKFNRKFKIHFKESPYQWLIKQRAKHIYQELSLTDKSFSDIAREFHFSDASHFNRYCKSMYGSSPSKVRHSTLSRAN